MLYRTMSVVKFTVTTRHLFLQLICKIDTVWSDEYGNDCVVDI